MAEFSVLGQINGGEQRKKRALGLEYWMCWFGFLLGLPEVWYQGDLSNESILVPVCTLYNSPITKHTGLYLNYLLKFHTWAPHLHYTHLLPSSSSPNLWSFISCICVFYISTHVYIYTCKYLHMYDLLVHLALLLCARVQGWSLGIGQVMWEFSTKATDPPSLSSP